MGTFRKKIAMLSENTTCDIGNPNPKRILRKKWQFLLFFSIFNLLIFLLIGVIMVEYDFDCFN